MREALHRGAAKVAAFYSGLPLNEGLYGAIKATRLRRRRNRSPAPALATSRNARGFSQARSGTRQARQGAFGTDRRRLSQITTKFSQNVLDSTNAFDILVTDPARLAGLPPSAVAAARASAESKNVEGWRFTLHAPSYIAATTYLDAEDIRRDLYIAFNTRASGGEYDNREIMLRVLQLRREKANLLGFRDFADLVLEDRMAHTASARSGFLKTCA